MPKTDITITDEQVQGFIADQIAAGHFGSADEVVTDAVRTIAVYREKRAAWNAMIDNGIAAADRGDAVDGESSMHDRIARLKACQ